MRKNVIAWDFKVINPSDYEAEIKMTTENKLLLMIFNKSRKKLKKKNIEVKNKIDEINKFIVDYRYYNMIKTIIRPIIKNIFKSCKDDGITILNYTIERAWFERDKMRDWVIKLIINGQYVDKR